MITYYSFHHHLEPTHAETIKVSMLRPFYWLKSGLRDFRYHPTASFAYGFIVTALMFFTFLVTSSHIYVIAAAICGFMFIGPILAAGLCELSWRHETNEPLSFDQSLARLRQCQNTLYRFAGVLLGFSIVWLSLSALVLSLTLGSIAPSLELSIWGEYSELVTTQQTVLYLLIGGLLMVAAFSVSVVSIPAIIEMNLSVKEAMLLSFKVFITNLPTMAVWGSLLTLLIIIGLSTYLIGMIVLFPLLGHATWYAYRDLVKGDDEQIKYYETDRNR
jgi:uncharacterized membrane protein